MNKTQIETIVGWLEIIEDNNTIININYIDKPNEKNKDISYYLNKTIVQIEEYFLGKRKIFDLKLKPEGTEFQTEVWKEILNIPFGKTKTYQEIAEKIGDPSGARAVGNANNKNPIPILIPCHRVIGANGSLTGYAGGIDKKNLLLNHEAKYSGAEIQLDLF